MIIVTTIACFLYQAMSQGRYVYFISLYSLLVREVTEVVGGSNWPNVLPLVAFSQKYIMVELAKFFLTN